MEAAKRMPPPPALFGPTKRPMEPLQVGMASGAGGGPELLRTGDRVSRTFRMLADVTGNARFAELAERAATQGR